METGPAQPPTSSSHVLVPRICPSAPSSPLGAQDLPSQLNPEPQPRLPREFGTRGRPRLVVVPLLVLLLVLLVLLLVGAMAARLGPLPCEGRHKVSERSPRALPRRGATPQRPRPLPGPAPSHRGRRPPSRCAARPCASGCGGPNSGRTHFRPNSLPPGLASDRYRGRVALPLPSLKWASCAAARGETGAADAFGPPGADV